MFFIKDTQIFFVFRKDTGTWQICYARLSKHSPVENPGEKTFLISHKFKINKTRFQQFKNKKKKPKTKWNFVYFNAKKNVRFLHYFFAQNKNCSNHFIYLFMQAGAAAVAASLNLVFGSGLVLVRFWVLFVCLLDAQILLRRQLSALGSRFATDEKDNCMFWLPPAIVLATGSSSASCLCTCDNIFIIFASFFFFFCYCRCHRRIASGRCVCKH